MPFVVSPDAEALYMSYVKLSCMVTIGESVLFFGGCTYHNQISQLTPRGLIRIGTLPFAVLGARCLVKGKDVYLGFANPLNNFEQSSKLCWQRLLHK